MDAYKILGQVAPGGTTLTELYEVPVPVETEYGGAVVAPKVAFVQPQTLVTSIVVCNVTPPGTTFDIVLLETASTTPGNEHYLFKNSSVFGSETKILSLGLTLGEGNTLKVKTYTAAALSFTAMGIEVR